jgi:hypothetical protein
MNDVETMRVAASFINFEQSRDILQGAVDTARTDDGLVYLNTMVGNADKDMVISLAKRYGVSQGFIMRVILSQWRASQLAAFEE